MEFPLLIGLLIYSLPEPKVFSFIVLSKPVIKDIKFTVMCNKEKHTIVKFLKEKIIFA